MPPLYMIGFVKAALVYTLEKRKYSLSANAKPPTVNIHMGNITLSQCSQYEYLGIILDDNFTLENSVSKTVSSSSNRGVMLRKMRKKMSLSIVATFITESLNNSIRDYKCHKTDAFESALM